MHQKKNISKRKEGNGCQDAYCQVAVSDLTTNNLILLIRFLGM